MEAPLSVMVWALFRKMVEEGVTQGGIRRRQRAPEDALVERGSVR